LPMGAVSGAHCSPDLSMPPRCMPASKSELVNVSLPLFPSQPYLLKLVNN
jgi:hypothetical protein